MRATLPLDHREGACCRTERRDAATGTGTSHWGKSAAITRRITAWKRSAPAARLRDSFLVFMTLAPFRQFFGM
ncbi:MAG: hypothetical protein A3G35_16865 [candidate division NC10 bacterium RIFCSPLOWO2_12_FULL_66_18]|nr:MAG: hypothetical protein A3G35_16865 [candidate division NC10 bacterium RIFCSPLOWO2_12_FULL_66_18]